MLYFEGMRLGGAEFGLLSSYISSRAVKAVGDLCGEKAGLRKE